MKTLLKYLLVLIIGLAIGAFISRSCSSNESLTSINNAMIQRDKNLIALQKKMEGIDSTVKALRIEKNEIKNYYTSKYYEIDSLANLDSLILYSIIRANTERLYRIPEFFSFAIRDSGTGENSKNSSSW